MGTTIEFRKFLAIYEAVQVMNVVDRFLEADAEPDWLTPAAPTPPATKKDTILDPRTGRNWRAMDRWRQLEAVLAHEVEKGTPPNRVWVTFSDVSKLGQRMRVSSGKSTPVGIFAFPAQYVVDRKANTPFSSRPYMHVFRIKQDHYEVGRKDYGDEPEFGKIKGKFSAHKTDPVKEDLQKVRSKFENFIYKSYSNHTENQRFKNTEDKDKVCTYLNELLSDTMDKLGNDYYYTSGSNPQEKIASLDTSFLDKPIEAGGEEVKEQLAQYMSSLSFYHDKSDEYKKRYKEVDPKDLSVELSPEYIQYIKNNPYDYHIQARQAAEKAEQTPTRFTWDEIQKIDSGAYDTYSGGYHYIKQLNNAGMAKDPIVAKFKQMLTTSIRKVLEKHSKPEAAADTSSVPHYDKLKMLADKYGLNLDSAIKDGMQKAKDERQFLYRATQELAKGYNKKHPETTWQSAWNKMFRDLGISGVADTEDSGYVHSAESTQGVFMNPKDVEQITTIMTSSHQAQADPASRPTASHWGYGDGMHKRNVNPYTQRKGPTVDMSSFSGKDAAAKTDYALDQRLAQVVRGSIPTTKIDDRSAARASQALVMVLTMLKSKLAVKPTGIGEDAVVKELLRRLATIETATPNMPPQLKQQIDSIRQVAGGQRNTGRSNAWKPTDDELNQHWPKKRCPNCMFANDDMTAKRCPSCNKFYPDTKPQTKDCENCGYENENLESKKCPECNTYYDLKDKPPSKKCPYCSHETEDMEQKKCHFCGHYYDPKDKPPVKECPNCGEETEDMEAKKCDNCGAYFDPKDKPEDEPDLKKCLKCNKMFDEDDDECPHCGAPADYDPDNMQTCDNCGEEFDIDDSKCPNCGYDPTEQHCEKCGDSYPEDDSECPNCGAPSGWNKHDYQECPECGFEFWPNDDDTCPKCGWDDPDQSAADKEEEEEDEPGDETPGDSDEPDTKCLNCGAEYKKVDDKCPKCGATHFGEPKKKKKEDDVISGENLPPPPEHGPAVW